MRANYRMHRLFIDRPLAAGSLVDLDKAQSNYLLNVLRMAEGSELLLFNGRHGEWRAVVRQTSKKQAELESVEQVRPQPVPSGLVYCFAPLKSGRLDYMVQKAVEMGAGVLQPVMTHHTQVSKINVERMAANAVEAAEQCGILAIPECREPVKFDRLLGAWDPERRLIFCDEDARTNSPLVVLQRLERGPIGVLIGPEGGFSDAERERLRALPFVTAIPLGPRILRADTASVAAMAVIQMTVGDWN
ncbi:16S rRNA (uracil(1498)-N(3))-methyltransferase [Oricola cellulosilytica]|uniref:Ribosomal RNA small subunit methyltransferase E n=1 Tax=Oricola cellulosilytica TaxID=1429082 RepID=A0A4R0PMV0_9HYPH|nr:16S rRNA (uracil(1498)-N(3))-methyltransferase [Oricola cellulosilytica]TCD16609.1 16S rRNA (uracil(1498)-N(3))-methyltransferase [Oricola cellulosilytica]